MSYAFLLVAFSSNSKKNDKEGLQAANSSCYSSFLAAAQTGFTPKRYREQLDKNHRFGQKARTDT